MSQNKKMGRPKIDNPKSRFIALRLDEERYQKMKSICERESISYSDLIRKLIDQYQ